MGDDLKLSERNCTQTPMQWSTELQGGFTTSDKPVVLAISDSPYGYQHVNVAEQRRDPKSLLNWTERIIRMRKEIPQDGWRVRHPTGPGSSILVMRHDWRNNSVLFVHNLSGTPREVALSTGLPEREGRMLVNLLTENHSKANENGKHHLPSRRTVPVVSGRGSGLPAERQRHRHPTPGMNPEGFLLPRGPAKRADQLICVGAYAPRQVNGRRSAVVTMLVATVAMSGCGSLLRTTSILQNDQGHIARCSGHDTLADPMGKRAHDLCVADLERYGYRVREKIE